MMNWNTDAPQMGTSHQNVYPSLSDTSTVRATNYANPNTISTHPQGGYSAGMHNQTNHKKPVVPSSMTSLNSQNSHTSQSTKANLRLLDIPRFTNSQEFHKTLSHISTLSTTQLNNISTQQRSGQEVAQRAIALLNRLAPAVDRALNKAFDAGVLSSEAVNPNNPGGYYPTEGSQNCVSKISHASRLQKVRIAAFEVDKAIQRFNDLCAEAVPYPDDPRFCKTALQHWLQHDEDLHDATQDFLSEIKDRLEQSLEIAAEISSRQPVAGNGSALLNSNNLLPQGGPMDQNNSRLMRTEGWIINQHEFDRPV